MGVHYLRRGGRKPAKSWPGAFWSQILGRNLLEAIFCHLAAIRPAIAFRFREERETATYTILERTASKQKLWTSIVKLKTHRPFYTQTLADYTQTFLHTNAFTHRHFFYFDTQMLLHTDPFTIALHRNTLTQRRFYRQTASHRRHTDAFTHRPVYAGTALHTDAFDTQTSWHTDPCTHRRRET